MRLRSNLGWFKEAIFVFKVAKNVIGKEREKVRLHRKMG